MIHMVNIDINRVLKKLYYIQLMPKKNYIILNFNYPMVNTFLVIFLNQKVGSILNQIC